MKSCVSDGILWVNWILYRRRGPLYQMEFCVPDGILSVDVIFVYKMESCLRWKSIDVLDRTYHNQMEPSLRDGNPVSGWHAESYPTGRALGVHKTGPGLTTTACLILVGSAARHGPHLPLRKLASIRLHDSKMDSIYPHVLSVLWTRQESTSAPKGVLSLRINHGKI
jgi:hypothetical protein